MPEQAAIIPGQGITVGAGDNEISVSRYQPNDQVISDYTSNLNAFVADHASVVVVRVGDNEIGAIALRDTIRDSASESIDDLHALGISVGILSGDSTAITTNVASEVGADRAIGEVLPTGKTQAVKQLQSQGRRVALVGDGINDAGALACADLGISVGSGTDVAIESADIIILRNDLRLVGASIVLSEFTHRVIRSNLWWAFAYNVAAIPIAAAGLLNPLISGAAMAASSALVVANSSRLRRMPKKPTRR